MGSFVNDAIYNDLNTDATTDNDVDMVFNNAGGVRRPCWNESAWLHADAGRPPALTYGMMFSSCLRQCHRSSATIAGGEILELLNQSAPLFKGAIQPAGMTFNLLSTTRHNPGPQPYGLGRVQRRA